MLERFQRQTNDALLDGNATRPDAVGGEAAGDRARRFDIYRNNRAVSLIENLAATYPAVRKLVGEEFFTAVARAYIDAEPPLSPVIAEYGATIGDFLNSIPSTQSIPYLRDVAAIEWSRNEAYHAADAPVLALEALLGLGPDELVEASLCLHPAARVIRSQWPAGSLWSASSGGDTGAARIDLAQSECVVVVRPSWDVGVHVLSPTTADFFALLHDGSNIGDAVAGIMQSDPEFDTGLNLSHLLGLGLFSSCVLPS